MSNNSDQYDICILGGGLCGLTLGYLLRDANQRVVIIEARDRLGGRIETVTTSHDARIELGATWLGKKHKSLISLLEQLDIDITPQYMSDKAIYEPISTSPHMIVDLPPNEPSYRIGGGSSRLIQRLSQEINAEVKTGTPVTYMGFEDDAVRLDTPQGQIKAQKVISTLPPYLLLQITGVRGSLPAELIEIMEHTHTWMGSSIKIALSFDHPFWRSAHTSGTIVSNVGPVSEMYDHTNEEGTSFALIGFLDGAYANITQEQRRDLVLRQLRKYYGPHIDEYTDYLDKPWRHECYTHADYKGQVLPHQHNGHTIYHRAYVDGLLWIAGAETAQEHPGYMDGAVSSAHWVYDQLKISYT